MPALDTGLHLRSIQLSGAGRETGFPFDVPVVRHLGELAFTAPVTFFVGENGSGKSTLLEAIACAAESIAVGSESLPADRSLAHVRPLARRLRLTWNRRTRRGFFLRAEDFFGYARRAAETRASLRQDLEALDDEYADRPGPARDLARQPYARELGDIERRYGQGLDSASHGESFLKLFQVRFVPDGLYLLDEPEAPLSPTRQLAFLALLKEMVPQRAQFIIATHSPILLAHPGAAILSFDYAPVRPVVYDELEHVTLTRSFLNDPQAYLRHL